MARKFRMKGYQIIVKEGYYDPDDDSFGDQASPRSHPNERMHDDWDEMSAAIARNWFLLGIIFGGFFGLAIGAIVS